MHHGGPVGASDSLSKRIATTSRYTNLPQFDRQCRPCMHHSQSKFESTRQTQAHSDTAAPMWRKQTKHSAGTRDTRTKEHVTSCAVQAPAGTRLFISRTVLESRRRCLTRRLVHVLGGKDRWVASWRTETASSFELSLSSFVVSERVDLASKVGSGDLGPLHSS